MKFKNSVRWKLPIGVVETVKGICKDYERKREALSVTSLKAEVRSAYEAHNTAVNNALLTLEPSLRYLILEDVAEKRGYNKSAARSYIAHNGYAERKCRFIYHIAVNLNLV